MSEWMNEREGTALPYRRILTTKCRINEGKEKRWSLDTTGISCRQDVLMDIKIMGQKSEDEQSN